MPDRKQQTLIQLLERRAWKPIRKANRDRYADSDRTLFQKVQQNTQSQEERYRLYEGAAELRQQFADDLRSGHAHKTNAGLKRLHLPIQAEVAGDFFALVDRLGVSAKRQSRGTRAATGTRSAAGRSSTGRSSSRSSGSKTTTARKPSGSGRGKSSTGAGAGTTRAKTSTGSKSRTAASKTRTASTSRTGSRAATSRTKNSSKTAAKKKRP
jgi:hypothetical protein